MMASGSGRHLNGNLGQAKRASFVNDYGRLAKNQSSSSYISMGDVIPAGIASQKVRQPSMFTSNDSVISKGSLGERVTPSN